MKPAGENREYLGIRDLLYETVNQKSKDKSPVPNMAAMVLQAIISGSRYPASLYPHSFGARNCYLGKSRNFEGLFDSELPVEGRRTLYGIE